MMDVRPKVNVPGIGNAKGSHSMDAIDYGIFIMPFHPLEKPRAQCHDEDLELIVPGRRTRVQRVLDR